MRDETGATAWSRNEFGGATLGNTLRTERLVQMGARALQRPAGKISEVFDRSDEREGAYRFVESPHTEYLAVGHAAHVATFRRAAAEPVLIVPIDGSSASLPAAKEDTDFGPVGNKWSTNVGTQVMNAVAVTASGAPVGPVGQSYWVRPPKEHKSRKESYGEGKAKAKRYRPIEEKESRHWGIVIDQTLESAREAKYTGRLWFQLDAGGDFFEVLSVAPTMEDWLTVRVAQQHRNMWEGATLAEQAANAPLQGTYELAVRAGPNRSARTATMEVRASLEVIALRWRSDQSPTPCPIYLVRATEISPLPAGEEAIEWLLLTTRPVTSLDEALAVIEAYAMRWRIEEVHKAWKSVAKLEESALESWEAFAVWATILFSVAVRIEHLKYLARVSPDAPARVALTDDEIEAIHVLKDTPPSSRPALLTIALAVRLIAELGGYTSPKSSGGPPGTITIGRGLKRVIELADTLSKLRRQGLLKPWGKR